MLLACSYAWKVLLSILLDSNQFQDTLPLGAFAALSSFLGWKCMKDAIFMACADMREKGRLKSAVRFLRAIYSAPTGVLALQLLLFCSLKLMSCGSRRGQCH